MRHVNPISKQAPRKADAVADVICVVTEILAGVIGALGGNAPIVDYLDSKCSFGVPDDGGTE